MNNNILQLLKREWCRGLISGQNIKLTDKYTVEELYEHYDKYLEDNEETRNEFKKYD